MILLGKGNVDMDISEKIAYRNEIRWKLKNIENRLISCAKVQEGKTPVECPNMIIKELEVVLDEYSEVLKTINKIKSIDISKDGNELSSVLAEREVISVEKDIMENFLKALNVNYDRYNSSDTKYINTVDASVIEKRVQELNKKYQEIETKFKTTRWNVDFKNSKRLV
ncbi:hypothetical protein CLTEP_11300 [Clostridium tepidiprofundi DSM 19306]|uniref:Uncharacterized protein n=1 Tax=Clostridium tepidiprofundi DSM 19306 TaxID=1121338 RepID=A0A151B4Z9_9CLOT|nr:DIP1984 family protein [Clostridium tepidiprofundi]KYH34966.1 hypothetical protein CLTEP_11300 [Clostridium tepidiprofundi DSM 19306]